MIKVLIKTNIDYQTYPEVPGMIKVSDDDLKQIGKTKCFDVKNKKMIDYTPEPEQE